MTFSEYVKLGTRNLTFILFITLFCVITGAITTNLIENESYNNSLFFTLSIKDKGDYSDAMSNLEASDQFTESLQGWFRDPSMLKSINDLSGLSFPLKAKKQEKNNLIISFPSDTKENAITFKEVLNSEISKKISAYNSNSDIRVFITSSDLFSQKQESKLSIYLLLASIIGILFGYFSAFAYEYFSGKLLSESDFKSVIKADNVFHFKNQKRIKLNHHFLTSFLNNKYKSGKIQLLDLTHQSKIGLEVLSKFGNFEMIKSFDIPSEISNVNPNIPVIVIGELGKTSVETLRHIKISGFKNIEAVLFDRI